MPPAVRFRVLHKFEALQEGELSVDEGERVLLSTMDAPEGWVVVARALVPSEAGLVPVNYVAEVTPEAAPAGPPAGAVVDLAAEDADLGWLADARHPKPDHQSWMLQAATGPWATAADAAEYAGSGWFRGEAVYSFSDAQKDELPIEQGEPLYVRCDEPAPEGWRHASRMDGKIGLVVSPIALSPTRPPSVLRPSPLASLPTRIAWRQPEAYVRLHDIAILAPVGFEGLGDEGSACQLVKRSLLATPQLGSPASSDGPNGVLGRSMHCREARAAQISSRGCATVRACHRLRSRTLNTKAGLLRFAAGDRLLVRVGVLSRGWWLARSAAGGPRGVVPRHLLDAWWRKEAGQHAECTAWAVPQLT